MILHRDRHQGPWLVVEARQSTRRVAVAVEHGRGPEPCTCASVCAHGGGSLGLCAQCLVVEVENLGQVWAFLHDQDLFAPVGDSLVDVRCARLTNGKRECSTWHIAPQGCWHTAH